MARSIQGQLLRQRERREVAIFLRDGGLWVAGFALERPSVNPESATAGALDSRSATGNSPMNRPPEETRERTDGPRECRLDAGIDSACTFN